MCHHNLRELESEHVLHSGRPKCKSRSLLPLTPPLATNVLYIQTGNTQHPKDRLRHKNTNVETLSSRTGHRHRIAAGNHNEPSEWNVTVQCVHESEE